MYILFLNKFKDEKENKNSLNEKKYWYIYNYNLILFFIKQSF